MYYIYYIISFFKAFPSFINTSYEYRTFPFYFFKISFKGTSFSAWTQPVSAFIILSFSLPYIVHRSPPSTFVQPTALLLLRFPPYLIESHYFTVTISCWPSLLHSLKRESFIVKRGPGLAFHDTVSFSRVFLIHDNALQWRRKLIGDSNKNDEFRYMRDKLRSREFLKFS